MVGVEVARGLAEVLPVLIASRAKEKWGEAEAEAVPQKSLIRSQRHSVPRGLQLIDQYYHCMRSASLEVVAALNGLGAAEIMQLVLVVELQGAWVGLKVVEVLKMVAVVELRRVWVHWEQVEEQRQGVAEGLRV